MPTPRLPEIQDLLNRSDQCGELALRTILDCKEHSWPGVAGAIVGAIMAQTLATRALVLATLEAKQPTTRSNKDTNADVS